MKCLQRAGLVTALTIVGMCFPAISSAAVLCVNKTGSQCDQLFAASQIKDAFTAANVDQVSFDKIEIGPGEYPYGPFNASSNIEIEGAGMNETVLTHQAPLPFAGILLLAGYGQPQVRDLALKVGPGDVGSRGLQISSGTLERVRIDALQNENVSPALDAFGVTARNIEVTSPPGTPAVSGGGLIEDSVIRGGTALLWNAGTARRLRLSGNIGAIMRGSSWLENSLVQSTGPDSVGVGVDEAFVSNVAMSHLTVVGDGSPGSVGIRATKNFNGGFSPTTASLDVRNTVVSGYQLALAHEGHPGPTDPGCMSNCQMIQNTAVSWSLLDGGVEDRGGPGELALGGGVMRNIAPSLMDVAEGDFRPRFDSPLLDAGEPVGLGQGAFYLNESPITVNGGARLVTGKGSGAARRDIGAFEYGRRPPSASLSVPGGTVFLYRPVRFGIVGSDLDGDPLGFELELREAVRTGRMSGPATGLEHSFAQLGFKQVKLTITDPTGLAAVASGSVKVRAKKGRCANRRPGGRGRDRFNGSRAGDRLLGFAGNDILRGGRASDCLVGGPGHDRLVAGPGRDTLNGGPGRDRIVGGPGRDTATGGPGNDRINVLGGGRDIVNCGSGRRDRVVADVRDRVRNCEIVMRR